MYTPGIGKTLDVVLVGAGPAALVALHDAKNAGLDAIAIDKGPLCGALINHPTYMRWFSTAQNLELAGFPLLINEKNPTRREYLKYCRAFARYFDLQIATYREVTAIASQGDLFAVTARDMYGRPYSWQTRNVVLGTGFYDSPRPLDVPGEDLPKVTHRYREAHFYADHDTLVIGGGSSAAEVALELWREGARVTVVMRASRFHTKYWIEPDLENRISEDSIQCFRDSEVKEIRPDDVIIEDCDGNQTVVPNDFVLAMTGYEPDTTLLESTGAEVDQETRKPTLTGDYETTVPGVYVIGTLCAGCESNAIFIENSRGHGPAIVQSIQRKGKASPSIQAAAPVHR